MQNIHHYHNLIQSHQSLPAHSKTYRFKIFLLAILGMLVVDIAIVVMLMSMTLAVSVVLVTQNIEIVLTYGGIWLIPGFIIFLAMPYSKPEILGIKLTQNEAPELFSTIKRIRRQLKAKPIHHVALTEDFNLTITQHPAFGFMERTRNTLYIGLPLISALSPDQFDIILTHELGHISKRFRYSNWVYQHRSLWLLAAKNTDQKLNPVSQLLHGFFKYFAPYFYAYTFHMVREHDLALDQYLNLTFGTELTTQALIFQYTKKYYLNDLWDKFYHKYLDNAEPPTEVHCQLFQLLKNAPTNLMELQAKKALAEVTNLNDTRPSLSARLKAIHFKHSNFTAIDKSAAERLLGEKHPEFCHQLDQHWLKNVHQNWYQEHRHTQHQKEIIFRLRGMADTGSLSIEDHLLYAAALDHIGIDALKHFQMILNNKPDNIPANFAAGRLLLMNNNGQGITHLEKAMTKDELLTEKGCNLIIDYLHRQNENKKAEVYIQKTQDFNLKKQHSHKERLNIGIADKFKMQQLSKATLNQWITVFMDKKQIKKAWLVEKEVKYFPQIPAYVLMVQFKFGIYRKKKIITNLSAELQHQDLAIINAKSNYLITYQIKKTPGALIYIK